MDAATHEALLDLYERGVFVPTVFLLHGHDGAPDGEIIGHFVLSAEAVAVVTPAFLNPPSTPRDTSECASWGPVPEGLCDCRQVPCEHTPPKLNREQRRAAMYGNAKQEPIFRLRRGSKR